MLPRERALKIAASLFVLYNLLAMLLMPNPWSFLGRRYGFLVAPYANAVGLNSSWNFFSPDPAQTMYISYDIEYLDEQGESQRGDERGTFPQASRHMVLDSNTRRELYAMRFMMIAPNRVQALFGPWLCREHPGATLIHFEEVVETVAPLDEALTLQEQSLPDLSRTLPMSRFDFRCDTPAEEFPL